MFSYLLLIIFATPENVANKGFASVSMWFKRCIFCSSILYMVIFAVLDSWLVEKVYLIVDWLCNWFVENFDPWLHAQEVFIVCAYPVRTPVLHTGRILASATMNVQRSSSDWHFDSTISTCKRMRGNPESTQEHSLRTAVVHIHIFFWFQKPLLNWEKTHLPCPNTPCCGGC